MARSDNKSNLIGGPFTRISYEPMNLNSSDQVKAYLFANGWVPDEYNFKKNDRGFVEKDENGDPIKTSPKLTESSFHTVKGEIPGLLARRNVLMHRKRMLKNVRGTDGEETGWINQLREDGRISAGAIPNGTNTGRMRHFGIVNVPSVDAIYGTELRSLFIVPKGHNLIGVDAAQLEARMQAHFVYPYPGGIELADLLLHGDIHQANADLWGCTRKQAKSPYYALMYGAQPPKLAVTMGCSLSDAKNYFNQFWDQYTPLAEFKDAVINAWESRGGKNGGYLKGIDGRKLFARSPHSLVNLMFQSAGSITVKYATVFLDKYLKQYKLRSYQVIHMHDEFQLETEKEHTDAVVKLALKAFNDAGRYLKMNVPIVGDAKVGHNWAETH